jgi:hypothetical protein
MACRSVSACGPTRLPGSPVHILQVAEGVRKGGNRPGSAEGRTGWTAKQEVAAETARFWLGSPQAAMAWRGPGLQNWAVFSLPLYWTASRTLT